MESPLLDQLKAQMEVLLPVLRAFREELGAERADEIALRGIAAWRKESARTRHAGFFGTGLDRWRAGMAASTELVGDAVEVNVLEMGEESFDFDVTGCRFAQLFRELGEPELGAAIVCAMDDTVVAEIGAGEVELARTGTIMAGAERCDFRYRIHKRLGEVPK
jgi:hypothetical protein